MGALGWLAQSALRPLWQQNGAPQAGCPHFLGPGSDSIALPSPQNNASKLLLAIMESRHDSENAERILYNMRPKELVSPGITPQLLTLFLCTGDRNENSVGPKGCPVNHSRGFWGWLMCELVKTPAGDPKYSQSTIALSRCSGLRWSRGQDVMQVQRGWPGICSLQRNVRFSFLCQGAGLKLSSAYPGC